MVKIAMVVLACAFAASPAFAAEPGSASGSQDRFRSLDKDRNGYISHDEAKDRHRVFWYYQRADQNSDGAVDPAEFSAFEELVPDTGGMQQK